MRACRTLSERGVAPISQIVRLFTAHVRGRNAATWSCLLALMLFVPCMAHASVHGLPPFGHPLGSDLIESLAGLGRDLGLLIHGFVVAPVALCLAAAARAGDEPDPRPRSRVAMACCGAVFSLLSVALVTMAFIAAH